MCRSCKSIVGGGEQQCAVCGTPVSGAGVVASQARPAADSETMRFASAVLNRPYKFTILLLVANIFVFTLMWQTSGQPLGLSAPVPGRVLVAFGAKLNYLIQNGHQWWRFVTPMFLHVNLLHLIVNMYSLWIVGPYVEKLYGSAKFVFFWVVTGVCGVVASYLCVRPELADGLITGFIFKALDEPSAGASGALFGLVGVLFVFGIKFRRELPEGFKRAFGTGLLPMIVLNLFIGYVLRGFIDNAAHLGGLVSGALLALVVGYRRPGERSGIAITWRVLQIAAMALIAVSFLKTMQHFKDPLPQDFVSYAKTLGDAQEAFFVTVKDGDVTPADRALQELESVPPLDGTANDLKEKLKALLIRAREQATAAKNVPKPVAEETARQAQQDRHQLATDFVAWSKAYNSWLKTSGRQHSGLVELTETEPPAK